MRIRKRLRINVVISLLIAFVIGLMLTLALHHLNKANNLATIAGNITTNAFERVSLRNDYMRSNSERAKDQWFDKNQQNSELLKSATEIFLDNEDRKIIGKMIEIHESILEIFSALVANREKNYLNAGLVGLPLDAEERLLNQLNIRVYEQVLKGRTLQESGRKARAFALKLAAGGVVLSLLVIIAAALINLRSMGRVITERINQLRNGALVIGDGNLDHLIDIKGDDEFAELSVAFNAMTAKLSGAYHSLECEIEERKRAEEALRLKNYELEIAKIVAEDKRSKLAAVMEALPIGVAITDVQGGNIQSNSAFEQLWSGPRPKTGSVEDYVKYQAWWVETGKPVAPEEWASALAVSTGETVTGQLMRIQRFDGSEAFVINSASPIRDTEGNIVGCAVAIQDITKLKRVEEALRARETDLNEAQRLAHIGSWHWDAKTDVTTGSDELLRIYGLDPSTQTMPDFREQRGRCYPAEDWEQVNAAVQKTMETGISYQLDVRAIKNGMKVWVTTRGETVRDADNQIVGLRGTVQDITELKQAEEQIKASLAEKEVMLKEIHHRVKNNLQVISSLISMQAETLTDERTREEFDDVCDRVRSMALIHEKLYQTDDMARLNFADYAASLLHSLWNSHDVLAEKVKLNLELAPVMLTIETAVPCGLILNELASNAFKHAFPSNNESEVTVGLEHDAATDTACLWVCDNGVGLPVGLDWRQSPSLGLRLVQILTGQLRGTVETGTSPGAEFRVTFPLTGLNS